MLYFDFTLAEMRPGVNRTCRRFSGAPSLVRRHLPRLKKQPDPGKVSSAPIIACSMQVIEIHFSLVSGKSKPKHRSGCPVSISLEVFGDRWSLLIIRDLMVRGYRTFKEFEQSGEGIATNILAHRLRKLRAAGIVETEPDSADRRKLNYRLTEQGIDLAPVLLEILIWGARHEQTGAPCQVIDHMAQNREAVLAEVRRRWQERDPRPFLPPFPAGVRG